MIKRKIIVLAAVILCLSTVFGIGGYLTNSSDAAESKQPKTEAVKAPKAEDKEAPASESKPDKETSKKSKNVKPANSTNDPVKPAGKKESNKTVAKASKKTEETKPEPAKPKKPTHTHDWEAVYSYETVEDISSKTVEICKGCGADITSWSTDKWNDHQKQHMLNGENSGFYEKEVKYVSGTHQIKHLTGYRCSCGATK